MIKQDAQDTIEEIIDQVGLGNVIDMLESICHEKASHLRENWQDESQAKLWDHDAKEFDRLRPRLNVPAYV